MDISSLKEMMKIDPLKLTTIQSKYSEQLKILPSALASVVSLIKLVRVATQRDDFELPGKGGLMLTQSFCGSVIQLANEATAAFIFSNSQFADIQLTSNRIPYIVKDMLENVNDPEAFKSNAEILVTRASSCASLLHQISEKFCGLGNLVEEINVQFMATTDQNQDIKQALVDYAKIWQDATDYWANLSKRFFIPISALTTAILENSISGNEIQDKFVHLAVKTCATVARIGGLTDAYMTMFDNLLEHKLHGLSTILPEAAKNTASLEELENQCLHLMGQIEEICVTSSQDLPRRIAVEIESLR